MRVIETLTLVAAICLLASSAASRAGYPVATASDGLQWGSPSDGVQMSLSSLEPNDSTFQLALRNVGDHDVTLNLGWMLANGKFQLPNYIRSAS